MLKKDFHGITFTVSMCLYTLHLKISKHCCTTTSREEQNGTKCNGTTTGYPDTTKSVGARVVTINNAYLQLLMQGHIFVHWLHLTWLSQTRNKPAHKSLCHWDRGAQCAHFCALCPGIMLSTAGGMTAFGAGKRLREVIGPFETTAHPSYHLGGSRDTLLDCLVLPSHMRWPHECIANHKFQFSHWLWEGHSFSTVCCAYCMWC